MKSSCNSVFRFLCLGLWVFAGISVLAMVLRWMELLAPDRSVWSTAFFGQLTALSELLPLFTLLLPILTGLAGRDETRDDPLRLFGLLSILAGGCFFLAGFLEGGLEAGWVFATAHPLTRDLVSVWQLLGILACGFGIALLSLLRWRDAGNTLIGKTAVLTVPGVALIASAALFALKQRLTGMDLVEPTVWFSGPAWPVAAGTTLLHTAVLLSLLGTLTGTSTQRTSGFRLGVLAVTVSAFLAPELRMLPANLPALPLLAGTFGHALLLGSWMMLLLSCIRSSRTSVPELQVLMLSALGGIFVLLGFWLNLVTASAAFSLSHFETARRFALGAAALFTLLPLRDLPLVHRVARAVLSLATFGILLPLLWLGATAVPAGLAIYPAPLLYAHALAFLAGVAFLGAIPFLFRAPAPGQSA